MDLLELEQQQIALAKKVHILPDSETIMVDSEAIIFGLDIQYVGERAFVAVDIRRYNGELLGVYGGESAAGMEYIPRFFCFREGPPLLEITQKVIAATQLQPNILLVDGHGIAHPLRLGVASWLGVMLGIPTIGMAKDTLLPYTGTLAEEKGALLDIIQNEEIVGKVVRTRTSTNPIFVSAGHLISLSASVRLALHFADKYRIPEPLRSADQWARLWAKEEDKRQGDYYLV